MIETILGALTLSAVAVGVSALAGNGYYRARQAAEQVGLKAGWTMMLYGERDGFELTYLLAEDHPPVQTNITLGFRLPGNTRVISPFGLAKAWTNLVGERDVQLGNDLDPKLNIRGPLPEVRQLLLDPEVDAALRDVLDNEGHVVLHPDRLTVKFPGKRFDPGFEARIERGVALAAALRGCWQEPWEELVHTYGLRDESDEGTRRLAGNANGVPLVVQQHRHHRAATTLRITAQLRQPLPPDTRLGHPDVSPGRSLELKDPVLGGQIHAVSSDPEALHARICVDAVRGPLLEVIRGHHPRSLVDTDRIGLLIPDSPLDPRPWVQLVLELEAGLSGEGPWRS